MKETINFNKVADIFDFYVNIDYSYTVFDEERSNFMIYKMVKK